MKILRQSVLGRVMGDSLTVWLANMAGVAVSVVATVFVTRELGPEGRGVFTWLATLAGIGSHFALFGLDNANRRFVPSEPEKLPELLKLNLYLIFGLGAVVALVLALWAGLAGPMGGDWSLITYAMLTVPLSALLMAMTSVFMAQQAVWRAAWLGFLPKLMVAVILGAMVIAGLVNLERVLALNLVLVSAACGLPLWWLRKEFGQGGAVELGPYVKRVWRTCSAAYVAGLAYYLMQKVDVLMIGHYLGEAPTGFYGVASNIVDLMIMPVSLIAWMLAGRIAAAHKDGAGSRLARQVVALTMALVLGGCAFTWLIAPWLIDFMFGVEFAPAGQVLRWLCFAVVGLSFFMLMHNILIATGRARYLAVPALAGLGANVLLNMWLIPAYGLWGACVASIVAYPLGGLVALWIIKRG